MFPVFSNYSFYFNNHLNSFQYYILQLYILHHYHAFTLYIPVIHNFSLYNTLSILSPPFILSSSLLSFLYTSTTFHAFLYVLLVQSCKDIIIYLVQQSATCPGDHHYLFYRFLVYVLFLCIFIPVHFFLFALYCISVTCVTFNDPFISNILFVFITIVWLLCAYWPFIIVISWSLFVCFIWYYHKFCVLSLATSGRAGPCFPLYIKIKTIVFVYYCWSCHIFVTIL